MRDVWYADNRDLVKWGVLVELAARHGMRHILQVLYYRPTQWPDIEIQGQPVPLPASVRNHFRLVTSVRNLGCPPKVDVIEDPFVDRNTYLKIVQERIRRRAELPGIVFLDPDTGLEPASPGPEHVLRSELADIWRTLPIGDLLVFYQHQTNRTGDPWVEPKKAQFEQALGLRAGGAGLARAPRIAADVVFFFAQKANLDLTVHENAVEEHPRAIATTTSAVSDILDCLNRTRTRATYGAVAEVIGGLAQGVGQRLGQRRPAASWVVSATSGLPSGYAAHEMHPDLSNAPLVRTGNELRALLSRCAEQSEVNSTQAAQTPAERFEQCRWRSRPDAGEFCTHRSVRPLAGEQGFQPSAWCGECTFFKVRRASSQGRVSRLVTVGPKPDLLGFGSSQSIPYFTGHETKKPSETD